jgi:hypothetical protein
MNKQALENANRWVEARLRPQREYAGRIIDGPLEGSSRAEPRPFFKAHRCNPIQSYAFEPVQILTDTYIWSYSLKAWCHAPG